MFRGTLTSQKSMIVERGSKKMEMELVDDARAGILSLRKKGNDQ